MRYIYVYYVIKLKEGEIYMSRYTEEMKLWLFDLAHGNLSESQILSGFLKHYVLFDSGILNVQNDIVYHTQYGFDRVSFAVTELRRVIERYSTVSTLNGITKF